LIVPAGRLAHALVRALGKPRAATGGWPHAVSRGNLSIQQSFPSRAPSDHGPSGRARGHASLEHTEYTNLRRGGPRPGADPIPIGNAIATTQPRNAAVSAQSTGSLTATLVIASARGAAFSCWGPGRRWWPWMRAVSPRRCWPAPTLASPTYPPGGCSDLLGPPFYWPFLVVPGAAYGVEVPMRCR